MKRYDLRAATFLLQQNGYVGMMIYICVFQRDVSRGAASLGFCCKYSI